tara:strand:+ start:70 stop:474 length:405 start_codon:yes stop_codon:yes gene_type:complete
MKNKIRKVKWKGEVDYDLKYDILFFKTKNREYVRSVELDNIILDIDSKGFIVGIQIFEASKFLRMDKIKLRDIPTWEFNTKTEQMEIQGKPATKIEIRLMFQIRVRNKLIEKNPIIMPNPLAESLPNSDLVCVV